MIKIDFIDFVANALIESIEKYGIREINNEQLNNFINSSITKLRSMGFDTQCCYPYNTLSFKQMNEEYKAFFTIEGNKYRVNDGISINELWSKFRGYLSCDIMNVFGNEDVVRGLKRQ